MEDNLLQSIFPSIILWCITVGVPAVVGFLFGKLKNLNKERKSFLETVEKIDSIESKMDDQFSKLEQCIDTQIKSLSESLDTQIQSINERIESLESKDKKDNDTLRVMLYDRITQACRYHLANGFCAIEEKRNVQELYEQYHRRGGNGFATHEVEKVLDLPDRPALDNEYFQNM